MKKWTLALVGFLIPMVALAASPEVISPPDWLVGILLFIQSIPAVGPLLVKVSMWAGVVASVMSALSVAVQGVLSGLSGIAGWAGLSDLSEKIKGISDKILPWLQYLSMFNVQKKSEQSLVK